MDKPEIPQKFPYVVDLEPGEYFWCSCGKSQKQPFCDGSHKGSNFAPIKFTVHEKTSLALCGCKHSKDVPFCDGYHNLLVDKD